MSGAIKIVCAVGTRPEAIKMAPVINALKAEPWCITEVLSTAQHRDLLAPVFNIFGIQPNYELNVMEAGQTLQSLTSKILVQSGQILEQLAPQMVLVHGDTTTAFALALSAFYLKTDVGHVEAGYRTFDLANPFPEELNRSLIARIARLHFAPSEQAVANLLKEGIAKASITMTGNTVIDALMTVATRAQQMPSKLPAHIRQVTITAHRRENIGAPFQRICDAIIHLARQHPDVRFLFVLHPNPAIRLKAEQRLAGLDNIDLVEPMDYLTFVGSIRQSTVMLSDSGGVQEEAPALGVPVVLIREKTERPEASDSGLLDIVGTNTEAIIAAVNKRLAQGLTCRSNGLVSPYGDGHAAKRIIGAIKHHFEIA